MPLIIPWDIDHTLICAAAGQSWSGAREALTARMPTSGPIWSRLPASGFAVTAGCG